MTERAQWAPRRAMPTIFQTAETTTRTQVRLELSLGLRIGENIFLTNFASDDPHLALTSQTLNADGTPKRPMNAFMIFARRRRPQISAANQMMRTGDISKILSKEWNTMDMVCACKLLSCFDQKLTLPKRLPVKQEILPRPGEEAEG